MTKTSAPDSFYSLLGISEDATPNTIKHAYHNLSKQYHPDRNKNDSTAEEKFKKISEAYNVLSNPKRKAEYDRSRQPSNFFDSIFNINWNMPPPASFRRRGKDINLILSIPFKTSVLGGSMDNIEVEADVECETCNGTGAFNPDEITICKECDGQGKVRQTASHRAGQVTTAIFVCQTCYGKGKIVTSPCTKCEGQGAVPGRRRISFELLKGIRTGEVLKIEEYGHAGLQGEVAGDLYITANVEPHDYMRDAYPNLRADLHVPLTMAVLGGKLDFESLDGIEKIDIPAGCQPDQFITINRRGYKTDTGRGNLLLLTKIIIPTSVNKEAKELFKKLAELENK